MRAVLDTNVLLSGLLWHGAPHRLIEQLRAGVLTLVSSPTLLDEFDTTLRRPKLQPALSRAGKSASQLCAEVWALAEIIDPRPLPHPVSRDRDDDAVLALAAAAAVDLIVTGDNDLLVLGDYDGIPIVDPSEALERLGHQPG